MGKSFQGPWGNFTGKIGNIVGRIRRGEQTLSIYQRTVNQPNTTPQLVQRQRFSLIVAFITTLGSWLDAFGKAIAQMGQTGYNAIMSLAMSNEPFTGSYPSQTIDLTKIKLSSGQLDLPYNMVANVDGNDIIVNWSDNSGIGNAKSDDGFCMVVYNAVKGTSIVELDSAKREDSAGQIAVPTSWNSDTLHGWLAFRSIDGRIVSDSYYLGSFTV